MSKRTPSATAETVSPWIEKLPAKWQGIAAEARQRLGEESPADRIARIQAEVAAEAVLAKRELHAERSARHWAMWCKQVPAIYVDERANPERRESREYAYWLGGLKADQHADKIAAWLADTESKTLWLIGPTGTGKTHAAMAAGYAAASRGVHARYVSTLEYLKQLRPGGVDNPIAYRERFTTTSLLVLDDFGAETGDASQFVRQELLTLLDERINQGRRQIITTNACTDELYEQLCDTFGDRIMDRLNAGSAALRYKGESLRRVRRPW